MKTATIGHTNEAQPRYYYNLVGKRSVSSSRRLYTTAKGAKDAVKRNHPDYVVVS